MPANHQRHHASPAPRPVGRILVTLLTALTLLGLAPPAFAATTFTITGRGWGHGVGMSQWGAYGLAKEGRSYREILQHYFTGIGFATLDNPIIRVRLRSGLSSASLTCIYDYNVQGAGESFAIPARTPATVTYSGGKYLVSAGSWTHEFSSAVTFTPTKGNLRLITASDFGKTGAHRGTVRVVRSGGALMMVNHVPMESYLRGVVPYEVSADWPAEALKAQACAARSEAEHNRRADKADWDVYCDTRTQAYGGVALEDSRTDAAIVATVNIVPAYKGTPILGVYFDCSGGKTEDVKYVWGGDYPYLKAVDDPTDAAAPLHTWGPIHKTPAQMTSSLGSYVKGTLKAITGTRRGDSPRIITAKLVGSGGTTQVTGHTLRWQLGLNSTWATFKSMSSTASPATVTAGATASVSGRLYPALKSGAAVTLKYRAAGGSSWQSVEVTTTRGTEQLADGTTTAYSGYWSEVQPTSTTEYYFASGSAISPTVKVKVQPSR